MKAILLLLAAPLVITLCITLIPLEVAARLEESDISAEPYIFIYKEYGNYPIDHWANPDCTDPVIHTDNGNATIRVSVGTSRDVYVSSLQGTVMNAGGHLTSVSYQASWKGNQIVDVYSGNSQGGVNFNLTNIPYGKQHITVFASSEVLLFENIFSSTYPVPQSAVHALDFTVARTASAQEPTPTSDLIQQ